MKKKLPCELPCPACGSKVNWKEITKEQWASTAPQAYVAKQSITPMETPVDSYNIYLTAMLSAAQEQNKQLNRIAEEFERLCNMLREGCVSIRSI